MCGNKECELAISRHVSVFTQQAFPRCYTIPRITAEGEPIGLHTHTHTHRLRTPPPPPSPCPPQKKREEGRLLGGRCSQITDQREEGRGRGSVNATVSRL